MQGGNLDEELQRRFPDMRPVRKAPGLGTVNGFGFNLFGKRDRDHDTGTYIKTWGFTALFIPLMALRAYRVADAPEGGWYFIGREKLSGFAKLTNLCIIGAIASLVIGGVNKARTSSPDYIAGKRLKEAGKLAADGNYKGANDIYVDMVRKRTARADEARDALQETLVWALDSGDKAQQLSAVVQLTNLPTQLDQGTPLVPNIAARAIALARDESDPLWSAEILDHAASLVDDPEPLRNRQVELLEKGVAANPNAMEPAIQLALAYEMQGRVGECSRILAPHRDALGTGEGARLLGRASIERGDYDQAYELLSAYLKPRLGQVHNATKAYEESGERLWKRWIDHLDKGQAPDSWYRRYESANEEEQNRMVNEFVMSKVEADPSYVRARDRYLEANDAVPVAIDLGLVQLNRAQAMPDPAAKRKELEAAEKTFLSIQSFAGETNQYRMFLGQVYFWLGKETQAQQLFDQMLESNGRSAEIMSTLASTLRDLGDRKGARELLEEAFKKSRDAREKQNIASLRANTQIDLDDRIVWLQRSDTSQPQVKANLLASRSDKALEDGDKKAAMGLLREADGVYDDMPENESTFNNRALVMFDLYALTGDPADYRRGAKLLERAVALVPSDAIVLSNAMSSQVNSALIQLVGKKLDQKLLVGESAYTQFSYLYADDAQRAAVVAELSGMEDYQNGMRNLDRTLLLAPKSKSAYLFSLAMHRMTRNTAELEKLSAKLDGAGLEFEEEIAESKASFAGENEQATSKSVRVRAGDSRKIMQAAKSADALTRAYAISSYVSSTLAAMHYGGEGELAELLPLAKEAHAGKPSSGTRSALRSVYLAMALAGLEKANPAFAKMRRSLRNVLGNPDLAMLVLLDGGPLASELKAQPDLANFWRLQQETMQAFATNPQVSDWAMTAALAPDQAGAFAARVKANKYALLGHQISLKLSPLGPSPTVEEYLRQKMSKGDAAARQYYEAAIVRGIPLPEFK